MDTASPRDFEEFERYLRIFADKTATGDLSPFARPLTLPRFLAVRQGRGADSADEVLFPSRDRARRVYLASVLGVSEATTAYLEELHQGLRALGVEVIDPWDWTPEQMGREQQLKRGRLAFTTIESCGRLLAILDGPEVASEVACAIGYARALGIRIDALKTDGGALESSQFAQVVTAIMDSGGTVLRSIAELPQIPWEQE